MDDDMNTAISRNPEASNRFIRRKFAEFEVKDAKLVELLTIRNWRLNSRYGGEEEEEAGRSRFSRVEILSLLYPESKSIARSCSSASIFFPIKFSTSSSVKCGPKTLPSDRTCDDSCPSGLHQYRSDVGGCVGGDELDFGATPENLSREVCALVTFSACAKDRLFYEHCTADCDYVFGGEMRLEKVRVVVGSRGTRRTSDD